MLDALFPLTMLAFLIALVGIDVGRRRLSG
jgi:hypothetical protein